MTPDSESTTDELKLLAIGDVHLGTRPVSLPDDLESFGVDPNALTPEAALNVAVERAIVERVDAVLFAGDVVESTNARFEAFRPLESAVRRLLAAGIPVIGVVGNHDVEALPRLARMIEGFELLGEGGRWQTRVIEKNGRPAAEIFGWSFPEKRVRNSPVAELIRNPIPPSHAGIPCIGLLHGDLDASGGNYAPFTSSELTQAGLDAWLLGHIHKPSLTGYEGAGPGDTGPRGYLGSLVGLDPGETGQHGPWLIRVSASGEIKTRQLVIAPLRWQQVDFQVGEDEAVEDISDRLLEEGGNIARQIQAQAQIQGIAPQALGLRLRLVGATRHYDALRRLIESGNWKDLARRYGDTVVFINKLIDGLELAHDLPELARGDDPPALLARKLLTLKQPGQARTALLEEARSELQGLASDPRWAVLGEERDPQDPLCDEALANLLTRSGTSALNSLLAQRDAEAEPDS